MEQEHPSTCTLSCAATYLARVTAAGPAAQPCSSLSAGLLMNYIGQAVTLRPGISIRLRRIALTTATVRLVVLSFGIAFLMWKLTVLSLIFRIIPISQDDFPSAVQRRHSRSRSDNSIFSFLCSAGCAISAKAI